MAGRALARGLGARVGGNGGFAVSLACPGSWGWSDGCGWLYGTACYTARTLFSRCYVRVVIVCVFTGLLVTWG
jgi:hypothetical protein